MSENEKIRPEVHLLWSGGWDGTFRLLQLAEAGAEIHPYYVTDPRRESHEYEKHAMEKIIAAARERFDAKICEITFYDKDWILENCADEKISSAFRTLRERYHVGLQYEWFALLTKHLGLKMEAGIVNQYHGKVEQAIDNEGMLVPIENDILPGRYCILPKEGNDLASTLFGNLILPIIRYTKKDEERIAREKDWISIMEMSWFCHTPIDGQPCGLCGPCDDAMNTGMEWRMPKEAQKRYKHKALYKGLRSMKRRLKK